MVYIPVRDREFFFYRGFYELDEEKFYQDIKKHNAWTDQSILNTLEKIFNSICA